MLATLGGENGVGCMELVRRGDVDHFHRRIGDEFLYIGIRAGVEIAREGLRGPACGSAAAEHIAFMHRRGLHHDGAGHAEARDAEANWRRIAGLLGGSFWT